jgi:phosphatidylglycerophosphate synthase
MTFWLAGPEKRLLVHIARRLPRSVTSDQLTTLGIAGAVGAGVAYALSSFNPAWLLVASAMLALNWFGDSLDGTLARVRHAERPRYGYYLDHCVDALSTAVIGIGLGLSPYVSLTLALMLVLAYLILSINVYLESTVFGVFTLAYGRVGPTEARLILIAANGALALIAAATGHVPAAVILAANVAFAFLAGGMVALVAARFVKNLRSLGDQEPARASSDLEGTARRNTL